MTRSINVAVAVGMAASIQLASPAPAAADGIYFFEAFGGTDIRDELGADIDNAFRIKAGVGLRRRAWALEGWVGGHIPGASDRQLETSAGYVDDNGELFTYGLDLTYHARVTRHLEVYVRGGLSRGELRHFQGESYAGRGLGVGAGVQLKGKVSALGFLFWPLFFSGVGPKVSAALFLDNGAEFYRLHRDGDFDSGSSIDARLTSMTLGFKLGYGF